MFQTRVVDKIKKTHSLCPINVFRKWCPLLNVEKYDRAGQTIDANIMRRMLLARWISKATDTHSEYVILITFPWRIVYSR
jgi:hypothetical protein